MHLPDADVSGCCGNICFDIYGREIKEKERAGSSTEDERNGVEGYVRYFSLDDGRDEA